MNKAIWIASLCCAALSAASSCRTHETIKNEYAYREFPPQFISSSSSGEITIKSWGSGTSTHAAVEQALENGIETILFKGIATSGNPIPPLVSFPDTETQRQYFDKFFKEHTYLSYIKEDKGIKRMEAMSVGHRQVGLTAVIDIRALESLLIKDKIISR